MLDKENGIKILFSHDYFGKSLHIHSKISIDIKTTKVVKSEFAVYQSLGDAQKRVFVGQTYDECLEFYNNYIEN